MAKEVDVGLVGAISILVLVVAAVIGWVLNLIAIAHSEFVPITGLLVLRIVGIFIGPIGAVLGYV